jgi:ribosomal-protein-alanine N-acetyltransferase
MLTITRHGVEGIGDAMPVMKSAFDPRYGESWTASQCEGVLAMPGAILLIARDPEPCGFALLRVVADEAELMLLAVSERARGRGVGRTLLRETIKISTEGHANFYFLEVRADNSAIELYRKEGLAEVGRRPAYYLGNDGTRRDALTFRAALHKN